MIDKINFQFEFDQLNVAYASSLDTGDFATWIDFFTDNCRYVVQSRENYDRNLPLALIDLCSKDMLKDRIYGVTDTIFHQPYYTRHVIGAGLLKDITQENNQTVYNVVSNYAVFRTKPRGTTEVFNVGYYKDKIIRSDVGLKVLQRHCVYDSELVLNALIYPI
jgi:salicylate 5-hydroxylase small subunit